MEKNIGTSQKEREVTQEYLGKLLLDERLYGGFCDLLDTERTTALIVIDGDEADNCKIAIARGRRRACNKIKFDLDALRNSAEETTR